MSIINENSGELNIQKYLPHNYVAEKFILSSLLINSEALETIFRSVKIETFYFKNHQELYKTILEMYSNQISIDILTLNTTLQNNGKLEDVGGMEFLSDLMQNIPNLIYLEQYINIIQDKFLRRSIIKLGYEIINSAYITNIPSETILKNLEFHLFNLTNEINEIKTQKLSTSAELFSNI